MGVVIRCALAGVLATAGLLKVASPRSSASALGTFGITRLRWPVLACVVGAELGLAAAVALGVDAAAYAAAGLLGALAVVLAHALARGRRGAPCACFGSRSAVGWAAVGRAAVLAGAFAAVPALPPGSASAETWLALGVAVALAGVAGLAAAVFALAREIGELRLQLGPQSALEVADEGPPLGERTPIMRRFATTRRTRLALAVFTSDGCGMCRRLEPAVQALAADPLVALRRFDEVRDADVWAALGVPGSPYAVAIDLDGVVRAKGTFNSFGQLESILAAAERRRPEAVAA